MIDVVAEIVIVPLLVYLVIDGLRTGREGFGWLPFKPYRDKQPIAFWLAVMIKITLIVLVSWDIYQKLIG